MNEPDVAYDYETCMRVWKRVSPELEPYPQESGKTSLDVLRGFISAEQTAEKLYRRIACRSGDASARRVFLQMAHTAQEHIRCLCAVVYLVTGERPAPEKAAVPPEMHAYREELRKLWQAASCGGMNYARAGEETTDPCISSLLSRLSAEEYRHAERILGVLAKTV